MNDEQDDIGQLIATIVSAAQALFDRVDIENPRRSGNLDEFSFKPEIKMLTTAGNQILMAAASADIRRIANEQIATEDSKLVRIA